jgi:ribosomal protein S18 acetylase RimI-like enzyme
MAARIEPGRAGRTLVDLRELCAADLEALLDEECQVWRRTLRWDFEKSAALVKRFVDLRALSGYALYTGRTLHGYAYFVYEDHKALLGDLFVRRSTRIAEAEQELLGAVLGAAIESPQVRRVEAQLLMMVSEPGATLPGAHTLRSFPRHFMLATLENLELPPGRAAAAAHIEHWVEPFQEGAAQLIAAAYRGHVDALINDQYRSVPGARRFLYNIVQYPGCGLFSKGASFAAFDPHGRMAGLCLASVVAPQVGHITQICVAPEAKGMGLGYELLRRSLAALRDNGCREASLTVTASNVEAARLYERAGFRTVRAFSAYTWDTSPAFSVI